MCYNICIICYICTKFTTRKGFAMNTTRAALFTNSCAPAKIHTIYIKDPASAITHFIAAVFSFGASAPLLIKAAQTGSPTALIAMAVYSLSLLALYSASTAYHTISPGHQYEPLLKKLDHMMIFILIAGSYTPVCLLAIPGPAGCLLLTVIWGIALAGMSFKFFWVYCPRWISSVLYIAMGWACIFAFPQLLSSLNRSGFLWLLWGGLLYTAGGVIYALKLPGFERRHVNFGCHEIFHLFVMAGSFCHYITMYVYLLN